MSPKVPPELPSFLQSITTEVKPGYWQPQTLKEWAEFSKTSAHLSLWMRQQGQEQDLRRAVGIWVFLLITIQVFAIFTIVILDATEIIKLNTEIVKYLVPSVLAEVFGMGFLVVKYLFPNTQHDLKEKRAKK